MVLIKLQMQHLRWKKTYASISMSYSVLEYIQFKLFESGF